MNGVALTVWDRWEIRGTKNTTLGEFLEEFERRFKIKPTGVFDNAVIVYMPGVPNAAKKLSKK